MTATALPRAIERPRAPVVATIIHADLPIATALRAAWRSGQTLNVPRRPRGPAVLWRGCLPGHDPLHPGALISEEESLAAAYAGSAIDGRVPLDEALTSPIWRDLLAHRAGLGGRGGEAA